MNIKDISRRLSRFSPEILVGVGIAGLVTAGIWGISETPKVVKLLENKRQYLGRENLTVKEKTQTVGKYYIGPALLGATSVTMILVGQNLELKRGAAIATAYSISEAARREYVDKVKEVIGDKKEQEVRDKISKEHLDQNKLSSREVLVTNTSNEILCYDRMSGRYFKSDMESINKAVNDTNRLMLDEQFVTLNEFYYMLGIPEISVGERLGWNVNKGYMKVLFSSQIAEDGTPCIVIDYEVQPYENRY